MSTLRINNIEAQSIPASPTIDEKVKVTNSSGDILVNIDGKTSGITTIGINTTDGNIKFDANSNVLITGILTATTLAGNFTPDSLEIGSNIKLGNAGVITATSFVGALTGTIQTAAQPNITSLGTLSSTTINGNLTLSDSIIHTGDTNTKIQFPSNDTISFTTNALEKLRIDSDGRLLSGATSSSSSVRGVFRGFAGDGGAGQGIIHLEVNKTTTNCGNGENLGSIRFGSNEGHIGALIGAQTESAWSGSSDLPSYINFYTCPDGSGSLAERLRITSSGDMGLGTGSPESKFAIKGTSGQADLFSISDIGVPTSGSEYGVAMIKTNYTEVALNVTNYNTYGRGIHIYNNGGAAGRDALVCAQAGGTRLVVNEDVTVSTGNLVIGTSGKGIDFSATYDGSNVSGVTATSELLSDYEEGTFQPLLKRLMTNNSTETSFYTQGTRAGNYTRIGDRVWITGAIYWNGGSTGSGSVILTNLPFTVNSGTANDGVPLVVGFRSGWNYRDMTGYSAGNMNRFYLAYYDSSGTYNISPGATATQGTLYFSANYELV